MKVSDLLPNFEHLIQHIAEEELQACWVHELSIKGRVLTVIADCSDMPRKEGVQKDLSDRLTARLKKHPMQGLHKLMAKVYHKNSDQYTLDGT